MRCSLDLVSEQEEAVVRNYQVLGFISMTEKLLFEFIGSSGHQESNNQAEETQDRAEDFNNEDLDESAVHVSISA